MAVCSVSFSSFLTIFPSGFFRRNHSLRYTTSRYCFTVPSLTVKFLIYCLGSKPSIRFKFLTSSTLSYIVVLIVSLIRFRSSLVSGRRHLNLYNSKEPPTAEILEFFYLFTETQLARFSSSSSERSSTLPSRGADCPYSSGQSSWLSTKSSAFTMYSCVYQTSLPGILPEFDKVSPTNYIRG